MGVSAEILGNRLKQARKEKNYTQDYVAEMVDLSVEQLSRIENGKKNVYLHKLALWCDVLDVPMEEILTGALMPANPAYNRQFGEIARDCSQETVAAMLDVCRRMAEVEKRAKTQQSD